MSDLEEGPTVSTPREGYYSSEESSYASSPSTPGANTPRPPSWIPESGSDVDAGAIKVTPVEIEKVDIPTATVKGARGKGKGALEKAADKENKSSKEKTESSS